MLMARIKRDDKKAKIIAKQDLKEHSWNVAEMAAESAKPYGFENLAKLAGILHDAGKAKKEFQKYLIERHPLRGSVLHSRAGAMYLFKQFGGSETGFSEDVKRERKLTLQIAAMAIMCHHVGPQDVYSSIEGVFCQGEKAFEDEVTDAKGMRRYFKEVADKKTIKELFLNAEKEVTAFLDKANTGFSAYKKSGVDKQYRLASRNFLAELILSFVIDADRRDAKAWDTNEGARDDSHGLSYLNERYEPNPPGFFRLYKYSGQGVLALRTANKARRVDTNIEIARKHAQQHGLSRVIYVTKTEQEKGRIAQIFRTRFGTGNVLEYQSDTDITEGPRLDVLDISEERQGMWSQGIIVMIQNELLSICYSMQPADIRLFKYLTNSVIVFDDASTIPQNILYPVFILSEFLAKFGQSTIMMCSDTLAPRFDFYEFPLLFDKSFKQPRNPKQKLTTIEDISYRERDNEVWHKYSPEELAKMVTETNAGMTFIIHNTDEAVKDTYAEIKKTAGENAYLLTGMAKDEVLSSLDEATKSDSKKYLVMTYACLDDIPFVADAMYCEQTGLDKIIRATGCGVYGAKVCVFQGQKRRVSAKCRGEQMSYKNAIMNCEIDTNLMDDDVFDKYARSLKQELKGGRDQEYLYKDMNGSLFHDFTSIGNKVSNPKGLPLFAPFSRVAQNFIL